MRRVILKLALLAAVGTLLPLTGCHSSSGSPGFVTGPKLTKDSVKGGPMPPEARAIFQQRMQAIAASSHSAPAK
jgi:hypothetical protein